MKKRTFHSHIRLWITLAKLLCSSEEKEACSLCWFCGSPALRLIACYIYSSNNNKSLTPNLIFRTQRQGIFASYEKRHKTSDLCFATQEDILVLNSILLFEGTSWILTWSNYYMVSIHISHHHKFHKFLPLLQNYMRARRMFLLNLRKKVSCIEGLWRYKVWVSLRKFAVSEDDLHGTLNWIFSFFIKGSFLTKLFICAHI